MVGGCYAKLLLVGLVVFESAQARILKLSPSPILMGCGHLGGRAAAFGATKWSHERSATTSEISEGLYEGDIVLTQQQKHLLQERKATNLASYWPKDTSGVVTVGYRFGDDIINQDKVRVAISHWEQNTCIRFKEVPRDVGYPHVNFTDAPNCASYVGRISSMPAGQNIWLHSSCVNSVGTTAHEIGHAMGFFHEQSRSDRDVHVKIMRENIQSGMEGNFDKKVTHNYRVPYDYSSVMHYGSTFFSTNGHDTILALNPMAQPVMGNRFGLSFADKLMANTMYGCLAQWLTACSLTSDPCLNLGYTGPDCNCVCPAGTAGSQCQELQDSYTNAIIKQKTPYSEKICSEGVVSTPGYPTPIQTAMRFVKVLVAPACYRVKLTVTDFHVFHRNDAGTCATDSLIIRTQDQLGTGTTYCDEEIVPGTVFNSETNTIVLDYHNRDYTTVRPYRGFNATIEHTPVDGCSSPTSTMSSPMTAVPVISFTNSGNVPLTMSTSLSGFCILAASSVSGLYELTNRQYPDMDGPVDSCSTLLQTIEPRYLRVIAAELTIKSRDVIFIESLFGSNARITVRQIGDSYVFPSSSVNIFVNALTLSFGKHFKLKIEVLNTDCHQIVRADAGSTGTLTKLNYAENTVCEWWIQAPSGRQIKLDFTVIEVGKSDCSAGYLAIDTSGDPRYGTASQQYCGRNAPGSVTSTGGQLNVLLNGLKGGHPGFSAIYSVV